MIIHQGINHLYEVKLTHFLSNELLSRMTEQFSISKIQQRLTGRVADAIARATEKGNVDFVFEMVKANPRYVWSLDLRRSNIFSIAVEYRRAKIFSLIYGLKIKDALACHPDSSGNTLLHMAGMSAPSISLDDIPGAALKMQRELQWFKVISLIFNFLVFNYWLYVH